MTREPLYQAVFEFFAALTQGATPAFVTATRKATTWENVAPEEQPALLMRQVVEKANYRKGLPTIWTCSTALMLYVHTGAQNDDTVIPALLLNPLVDLIEAAIKVDDFSFNTATLGGLVSHCAISGDIQYFEGTMGDEAVAVIPIEFRTSP
jgi:hypothetical protein